MSTIGTPKDHASDTPLATHGAKQIVLVVSNYWEVPRDSLMLFLGVDIMNAVIIFFVLLAWSSMTNAAAGRYPDSQTSGPYSDVNQLRGFDVQCTKTADQLAKTGHPEVQQVEDILSILPDFADTLALIERASDEAGPNPEVQAVLTTLKSRAVMMVRAVNADRATNIALIKEAERSRNQFFEVCGDPDRSVSQTNEMVRTSHALMQTAGMKALLRFVDPWVVEMQKILTMYNEGPNWKAANFARATLSFKSAAEFDRHVAARREYRASEAAEAQRKRERDEESRQIRAQAERNNARGRYQDCVNGRSPGTVDPGTGRESCGQQP